MPYCPACRKEYAPPAKNCEACAVDLVDSLPQESADGDAAGLDLVELARFSNASEAEMIKELLEKNEVGTVLRGEIDPIGIASRAESTTLLVEQKDLSRAHELYEAYFAGDGTESALSDQE